MTPFSLGRRRSVVSFGGIEIVIDCILFGPTRSVRRFADELAATLAAPALEYWHAFRCPGGVGHAWEHEPSPPTHKGSAASRKALVHQLVSVVMHISDGPEQAAAVIAVLRAALSPTSPDQPAAPRFCAKFGGRKERL